MPRRTGCVIAFAIAALFSALSFEPRARAQASAANPDPWHTAGQAALDRGDLTEARHQFELGLSDAQRAGARDRLASSQLDLARIYTTLWLFSPAARTLESGRADRSNASPPDRLRVDSIAAEFEAETSDFDPAKRDLQDAINLAKGVLKLGADHPKTATLYSLLGRVEVESEQYAPARQDIQAAVGILTETYGPDYVETAVARDRYAELLLALGHYNEALVQATQAENTARRLGPKGRPALAEALLTHGQINLAAHRLEAARDELQEAYRITGDVFTGSQLRAIPCLAALAGLALESGDAPRAWMLIQPALETVKQTLEIDDPSPISGWLPGLEAFRVGAEAASRNRRFDDAKAYVALALKMADARLGPASLAAARVIETRGDVAFQSGDIDGAEADYTKALTIRESVLSPGHPDRARSIGDLAEVDAKRGKPFSAIEPNFRDTINKITAETGNDSLSLIPTLQKYASFLRQQKRDQDAAEQDRKLGSIMSRQ